LSKRKKLIKRGRQLIILIILGLALVYFLFPIYFIVSTAFKERVLAFSYPPQWVFKPTLTNFRVVLAKVEFTKAFLNSVVVALSSVFIAMILGVPAGYALARYRFKSKKNVIMWILSTRMAPPIVIIIPFFVIVNALHLYDTKIALVVIYTVFNLPLSILMMKSFFEELPIELEEAGLIDGGTVNTVFRKIVLPLVKPGLAATFILCFIFSWNEFMLAMILTGRQAKTLPVVVTGYIQQTRGILWAEMSAASVMIMIPLIILSLFIQKYLVRGLTFGSIK